MAYRVPPATGVSSLAGSPFAKLVVRSTKKKYRARKKHVKASVAKSDFTLRVPQTPDREKPIELFNVWFASSGQRHAPMDFDASSQEYGFDPLLGHDTKTSADGGSVNT